MSDNDSNKDLNLNALSRYSKKSPRFVLEVYSHCEVPAGCGGAVLRWRDSEKTTGFAIKLYTCAGETELTIDGKTVRTGRYLLTYEPHVIAMKITGFDSRHGIFMLAGVYTQDTSVSGAFSKADTTKLPVRTLADGSWRYTIHEQLSDTWKFIEYDDSDWSGMIKKAIPAPDKKSFGSYQYNQLTEMELDSLGISEKHPVEAIWVRHVFEPPRPAPVDKK